ncbi:SDR family NAD(P)-dependent oxidoreductase [Streptomyces albofaciens JCM 4342]|uniref:SDR family NAD(P)-dependent oxidoreductase n=1 Tax=Streptomyces albofaciens TaxID=66866 RepID=UPI00123BB2F5|nr:SDR family NAD(P)-dependent oxidoreductase [Streptomyces albofaciens]KAA6222659.1 SDR family NAD(P)-dependent oxidoreductase [Streptomyces albofaciens JCM 4342]
MPVAVITGASKGLGRALGAALARRGWDLVVDARSAGPLEEAARELRRGGARVVALPGDVADAAHRAEMVAAARGLGGLDLLVNNASVLGAEPLVRLEEHALDGLRAALEVNTVAPLGLVQEALPLLRASSLFGTSVSSPYIGDDDPHIGTEAPRSAGGAVLNISSDAAAEAYETWGGYGAAKAALDQLSAVLAVEEPGLRVWWVDPGDMRTDLYAAAVPGDDGSGRPLPETVVPALLRLLDAGAASGRYAAPGLLDGAR